MDDEDIRTITRSFGAFEVVDARALDKPAEQKSNRGRQSANPKSEAAKTFSSKIFDSHAFGYRRITIERPLRESFQFSDERIASLRFASGPLNAAMQWVYGAYGNAWTATNYGELQAHEDDIRLHIKTHFTALKEKQIKDLLDPKLWQQQCAILNKAQALQQAIGDAQHDDMNAYDAILKQTAIKLDATEKKQITAAVSWKNPLAEKVIKKIHKGKVNPIYGLFAVNGKVVEYKADSDLRDNENVPLDPTRSVNESNEAYFSKEVQPHVPDAWIDNAKRDAKDGEIGFPFKTGQSAKSKGYRSPSFLTFLAREVLQPVPKAM